MLSYPRKTSDPRYKEYPHTGPMGHSEPVRLDSNAKPEYEKEHPMCHVKNPITGEVRYVTTSWARWLKMYTWQDATFDEFMQYAIARLNVSGAKL